MGMKKIMNHIDISAFHSNTHQERTVQYKGYIYIYMYAYIYKKNAFSTVYYVMKE